MFEVCGNTIECVSFCNLVTAGTGQVTECLFLCPPLQLIAGVQELT